MFILSKISIYLRKRILLFLFLILVIILFCYGHVSTIKHNVDMLVLPILVMACDRPSVKICLDSLLKFRFENASFPIIVSQDCNDEDTFEVIKNFADRDPTITYVQQPDQSDIATEVEAHLRGYYKIARHYKFALNYIFKTLRYKAAVIVEDDLVVLPDFFEYFVDGYGLLCQDPTIWCVSAWNDNCKQNLVNINEPQLLHRTEFFPGLGWMILSRTWTEIEPSWPEAFFDDWMRDPVVSRGRVCIRPELSRAYNFGRHGVGDKQFFDKHISNMLASKQFSIQSSRYDLSYLLNTSESIFVRFVYSLPEVNVNAVKENILNKSLGYVRIPYSDGESFKELARTFGLVDDLRHGIPRTGLRGIVQFFTNGRRIFLTPKYPIGPLRSSYLPRPYRKAALNPWLKFLH